MTISRGVHAVLLALVLAATAACSGGIRSTSSPKGKASRLNKLRVVVSA
jgi:hypothetical protein